MVNKMTKPFTVQLGIIELRSSIESNHRFDSDDSINEISMDCCIGCWVLNSLLPWLFIHQFRLSSQLQIMLTHVRKNISSGNRLIEIESLIKWFCLKCILIFSLYYSWYYSYVLYISGYSLYRISSGPIEKGPWAIWWRRRVYIVWCPSSRHININRLFASMSNIWTVSYYTYHIRERECKYWAYRSRSFGVSAFAYGLLLLLTG